MMSPRRAQRTVPADKSVAVGRLTKAQSFLSVADEALDLADTENDVADAAVTLYVHAGIAAADAICAAALGLHAKGSDHAQAVTLLAEVDKPASRQLSTLIGMKTRAGYGHDPMNSDQLRRARRAAQSLVNRART